MAADGAEECSLRPQAAMAAPGGRGLGTMLGFCTAILAAGALALAQSVLAPVAFALFVMALAWPVQAWARRVLPQGLALLLALMATLVVLVLLAGAAGWAFGRVARWVIANAALLQSLYAEKTAWLGTQGIVFGEDLLSGGLDARRLVRLAQGVLAQLQGIATFLALTFVFVLMGLLEADAAAAQLRRIGRTRPAALKVLAGLAAAAAKLRGYMAVRTLMSVLTGLAVWAFAAGMGLELAAEWGVIAFVLNYIPFIGPLVATLFPTLFAALQFGNWQVVLVVFVSLQVIQNLLGSYVEPRLTGARLALSPFMVLVAVFLGAFLWGIPGAFIGVPALIAGVALCAQFEGGAWVADLLSGRSPPGDEG